VNGLNLRWLARPERLAQHRDRFDLDA
jgi:hypothetical protein